MDSKLITTLQTHFDGLAHHHPEEQNLEFWFARDIQEPLGYARWENFTTAIERAITSCKTTGYDPEHHFRGVTKMVVLGSVAEREIEDFMLTRYACYLIAQNGDPRKEKARLVSEAPVEAPVDLTETDRRILSALDGRLLGSKELLDLLGYATKTGNFKSAIGKLSAMNLIEFTIPDKPNSRLQKYRLTEAGRRFLASQTKQ